MKARPLPIVICQALDAFRVALDDVGVKHSIQPPESYTTLVKSREVLLKELRHAQDACSGSVESIKFDLLFKKNHPAPLVLVTEAYKPPPTTDEMIERAHASEHVRAMGDWIVSALGGLEDLADIAIGERFAEEALRMSAQGRGRGTGGSS